MLDLNEAINKIEQAVLSSKHTPDYSMFLYSLGVSFESRFDLFKSINNFGSAVKAFEQASRFECFAAEVSNISERQYRGARLVLAKAQLKIASRLLSTAVELLPLQLAREHSNRSDQQFLLSQYDGLASDAAALSARETGNAYDAVRLLELGRGMI